jgi:histidine triad (HIT) family protein
MDCIFCKIIHHEKKADFLYQDETVVAFDDIQPKATHHKLIVPNKHIATLNDLAGEDYKIVGHMIETAAKIAKKLGIADDGYRVVLNCNANGGQTVYHIHAHLLGGRMMHWPPG